MDKTSTNTKGIIYITFNEILSISYCLHGNINKNPNKNDLVRTLALFKQYSFEIVANIQPTPNH